MKRTMVNVVFILSCIVMVTSPAFSQSKNPIKIGGSLGITGLFSEQCKWIKRGYETWVEDVNKRGGLLGRPVELTIYDALGRLVRTLARQNMFTGEHEIVWDGRDSSGRDLPAGIYLCRFITTNHHGTIKLLLLR